MEIKEIIEIIDNFFDEEQKQSKEYIEQFGIGNNRDIDEREKSTIRMMPFMYRKKLKELFVNATDTDSTKEETEVKE